MDRKSILVLVIAIALLLSLSRAVDYFFPPKPIPPDVWAKMTNHVSTNALPSNSVATSLSSGTTTSNVSATASVSSAPEQIISVTNEDLIFNFTSHGGGLKTVWLRHYPAVISRTGKTTMKMNMAALNKNAPVPVLTLSGYGGDGDFTLSQNGRIVTAEKTLTNGLRLVKEFDVSTNYLFTAHVRLENPTGHAVPVAARELIMGTASPIGAMDDPTTLGTFWYNGIKAQNVKAPWFANHLLSCAILPGTPRTLFDEGTNNVVWAAVHNQFFTFAAVPANPAPRLLIRPIYISPPDMEGPTNATSAFLTNGYQMSFWYPEGALPAHQTLDNAFTFYAGPKEYNRLARIGLAMNNHLDLIMDFSGPIGFFSKTLLLSMNGLNAIGKSIYENGSYYGWAIIAITVIIKIVFWPLTRASTRSQKRMQALQPQMKAIADKYKDDPVKKNQKTMEFMKEHKVSPLGSCLPTLIQIPVFFGFYWMLRNSIELRGVHFLWAHDLSQPDTIYNLPSSLPILAGFPINPLPLIMGGTQLWQAQILPASPGMDPGQQKMMRYMPLMFIALLYRMSAGLTLYWTIQNLLSILQTKLTKTLDDPGAKPAIAIGPKKKT